MAAIPPSSSVISKPNGPTAAKTPLDTVNPMTAIANELSFNAIPHASSVNAIAIMPEAEFFDMLRAYNVNAAVLTRELPGLTKDVAKVHRGLMKKGIPVPGHLLRIIPILVVGGDDIEKCRNLLTGLLGDAAGIHASNADAIGNRVEPEPSPALISAPLASMFALGATIAVTAIAAPVSNIPPLRPAVLEKNVPVTPPMLRPMPVPTTAHALQVEPTLSRIEVKTAKFTPQALLEPPIPAASSLPAHPPVTTLEPAIATVAIPVKFGPPGRASKDKGKSRAREQQGSMTQTRAAAVTDASEEDELESEEETTEQGRQGAVAKGKCPQWWATQKSVTQVKMEAPSDDDDAPSEIEEPPSPTPRALRSSKRNPRQRRAKAAPKTPAFVQDSDEEEEGAPVEVDRYATGSKNEDPCTNCVKRALKCNYIIDRAITQCQRLKSGCSISAAKLLALKAAGEKRVRRSGAGMAPRASIVNAWGAGKLRSKSSGSIMKGEFSGTPDPAVHVSFSVPERPSTRSSSRLARQSHPTPKGATGQVQQLQREIDELREQLTQVRRDHEIEVATVTRRFQHVYETQAVLSIELVRQLADGEPCALWLGRPPNRASVSMEVAMAQQAQAGQFPITEPGAPPGDRLQGSALEHPAVATDGPPPVEKHLLDHACEQETAAQSQSVPRESTDIIPPPEPPSHVSTTHNKGPPNMCPLAPNVMLEIPVDVSRSVRSIDNAPTSFAIVPQITVDVVNSVKMTSAEKKTGPAVDISDHIVSTKSDVNMAGKACTIASQWGEAVGLGGEIATLDGTGGGAGSAGKHNQVERGQKRPRSISLASDQDSKHVKLGTPE